MPSRATCSAYPTVLWCGCANAVSSGKRSDRQGNLKSASSHPQPVVDVVVVIARRAPAPSAAADGVDAAGAAGRWSKRVEEVHGFVIGR